MVNQLQNHCFSWFEIRPFSIENSLQKPSRRLTEIYNNCVVFDIGEDENEEWKEPRHLCHILATGVYPSLSVTDARCYGSAATISKKQLWSFFSLDKFDFPFYVSTLPPHPLPSFEFDCLHACVCV